MSAEELDAPFLSNYGENGWPLSPAPGGYTVGILGFGPLVSILLMGGVGVLPLAMYANWDYIQNVLSNL